MPMMTCYRLLPLAILLLSPAFPVHAQVREITDLNQKVIAGRSVSYLQLIKKVFPKIEVPGSGIGIGSPQSTIPLRGIDGDYRDTSFDGEMDIQRCAEVQVARGGKRDTLLLINVTGRGDEFPWGGISVLALFQLSPEPRLIDAVDVQADRFTGFWESTPVVKIAADADAVVIDNSHFNSSQGYRILSLIAPVKERLKVIYNMPTLLNMNVCGGNFDETPTLSTAKTGRNGYRIINVGVLFNKKPDPEGCEKQTRPYRKQYSTTLTWDARKQQYADVRGGLQRLASFNESNF
jgi:hypothetical protein